MGQLNNQKGSQLQSLDDGPLSDIMPVLTMTIIGNTSDKTLIRGVVDLFQGGLFNVSLVVFVCSILAPASKNRPKAVR